MFRALAVAALAGLLSTGAPAKSFRGGAKPPVNVSIAGLHVVGNLILNSAGQSVPLRGVNISGAEYDCLHSSTIFDGATDAQLVATLPTWAISVVRIPLNEDCWLNINNVTTGGATYQTAIVNRVNALNAAGIAVILPLQWAAPGTLVAQNPDGSGNCLDASGSLIPGVQCGQLPVPDADHAGAFWASVANVFKTNPSVLFDLWNEPFPDNNSDSTAAWVCLRDGGTCPAAGYSVAGMSSLVSAVRGTGATNIIMIPGLQFSNTLTQWLAYIKPLDTNLVASWHSYSIQGCNNISCWNSVVKPVMAQVPLITGEIGENDCQGIYVDPLMTWLDSVGGNYLAWAWNTYDCAGYPAVVSSYDGTPTAFGAEIRNHILLQNGIAPPVPPPLPMFSNTYPFGLAVGSPTVYTASDGTVYQPDPYIQSGSTPINPVTGLTENMQYYQPYHTTDTITGTSDPTLYQYGREGPFGIWTINVPNGNYTVTLGMSYNSTYSLTGTVPTAPWGQDQTIQGNQNGTCVWSSYSGTNAYVDFTGGITGGSGYTNGTYTVSLTGGHGTGAQAKLYVTGGSVTNEVTTTQGTGYQAGDVLTGTIPGGGSGFSATVQSILACLQTSQFVPVVDTAYTATYSVSVFNQQLQIRSAASFGGLRVAILNSIKVVQVP